SAQVPRASSDGRRRDSAPSPRTARRALPAASAAGSSDSAGNGTASAWRFLPAMDHARPPALEQVLAGGGSRTGARGALTAERLHRYRDGMAPPPTVAPLHQKGPDTFPAMSPPATGRPRYPGLPV